MSQTFMRLFHYLLLNFTFIYCLLRRNYKQKRHLILLIVFPIKTKKRFSLVLFLFLSIWHYNLCIDLFFYFYYYTKFIEVLFILQFTNVIKQTQGFFLFITNIFNLCFFKKNRKTRWMICFVAIFLIIFLWISNGNCIQLWGITLKLH